MPEAWVEAMTEFYGDVERDLSRLNVHCAGCGQCCRFDLVDHVLYASALERLYLLHAAPPPEPADAPPELLARGLRCPYQAGERCLAREGRVLGCRLHFCTLPESPETWDLSERWHNRLKRFHEELGVDWDYRALLPL